MDGLELRLLIRDQFKNIVLDNTFKMTLFSLRTFTQNQNQISLINELYNYGRFDEDMELSHPYYLEKNSTAFSLLKENDPSFDLENQPQEKLLSEKFELFFPYACSLSSLHYIPKIREVTRRLKPLPTLNILQSKLTLDKAIFSSSPIETENKTIFDLLFDTKGSEKIELSDSKHLKFEWNNYTPYLYDVCESYNIDKNEISLERADLDFQFLLSNDSSIQKTLNNLLKKKLSIKDRELLKSQSDLFDLSEEKEHISKVLDDYTEYSNL